MNALEKAQAEATRLKREAARAAEAAETAAAVEAEKLADAKRKEKEARNGLIFDRYLTGVKAAIAAQRGADAKPYEVTGAGNYFSVRQGPGVSCSVRLVEECSTYSYSRPYNGKWRAQVGGYGNSKQWPQRKDGSHNYEAIAEFIIDDLDRQHGFNVRHDQKRDNRKIADNIALNFDLADSGRVSVEATADPESPVAVAVRFTSQGTRAEAEALLKKLEAAGVTFP